MEEITQSEAHLTSAAAFVEGGIQDACDDACSICLEAFCESDPSSLTSCKHEFHLQCILDWCQRSSQCPMCWQPLSLKDPTSQELLEAVEHERSFRLRPSRNTTIFHHPTLGDFELQHLPIGTNDAELEEHIIQQLAAAAAMARRQIARREGQRNRSSGQGRPQFLVFSSHPNMPTSTPISSSPTQIGVGESVSPISISIPSSPTNFREDSPQLSTPVSPHVQANSASASTSGSAVLAACAQGNSSNIRSPNQSSTSDQDRAGPSDFQSFSESFKSKFNAVSMRYKESISKSTRGWKERFFSRNTTMADLGSEVRREVNAGIARVSQMMEHLETRDNSRTDNASVSNGEDHSAVADLNNQSTLEAGGDNYLNNTTATTTTTNMQTSCATSSGST